MLAPEVETCRPPIEAGRGAAAAIAARDYVMGSAIAATGENEGKARRRAKSAISAQGATFGKAGSR